MAYTASSSLLRILEEKQSMGTHNGCCSCKLHQLPNDAGKLAPPSCARRTDQPEADRVVLHLPDT